MTATGLGRSTTARCIRAQAVVMLGASSTPICGVRDYSRRLSEALAGLGVRTVNVWWEIDPESGLLERRRGVSSWLERLRVAVNSEPGCAVVWQYSVFTCGHRGVPTFVPRIASRLARMRVPRVGILHEFAYPFGRRGLRGGVHASTQRLALACLYRVLDGAVVTTEARKAWLDSRMWLPRRPTVFLPVCSNVPKATDHVVATLARAPAVGVFGFASETYAAAPVLGAVSKLRRRGVAASLTLIGAPGPGNPQAELWRAAAAIAGCPDALSFTGVLEPEAVARALQSVDVLVLPDDGGPSGRKGTLAAALAAGKPVIAFDGPDRWETLVRERAVLIAPPEANRVADVLERFLCDSDARTAQGAHASAFYANHQAPEVIASGFVDFLDSVQGAPRSVRGASTTAAP